MNRRSVQRYLVAGASLALTISGWLLFAPQGVGGPVSYVMVIGSSMEPALSRGDLVLVRESDDYKVNDVVAYYSQDVGGTVLHRLVQQQDGRFLLKGDNNDWLDAERPTSDGVVGKLWVRVPGAGSVLMRLREPRSALLFLGGAAAIAIGLGSGRARVRGSSRELA